MTTSPTNPALAGTSITCGACQRANPSSRQFCGACGKALWQSCPQCQAQCAVDERFCGACGADVLERAESQTRELEGRLEKAFALASAHRYEAAISELHRVAEITDPRFENLAAQARETIGEVEKRRRHQQAEAEKALAQAREFIGACAFESAQSAIEGIPEQLRTDEHHLLLDRAKECRRELLELSGEIRQAVEQKRFSGLLPKLERLLVLKPNHAQAHQLARALSDNLVRTARSRLDQHKYREALDALEQIPAFVHSEETRALLETATELESLLQAVRNAPLADAQLLGLAGKLCTLAPNNSEAARLRLEIAERIKTRPAEPRLGAPDWSPGLQQTALGVPLDWLARLTGPQRASEQISQSLDEHPGQFFTAFGLALAGVGLAAVEADLTPQGSGGMLGRLPSLPFGKRVDSEAWGLDLSDYALKAIKVKRAGKASEVQIAQCEYILHSIPLAHPDAEPRRAEIAERTLRDFIARAGELKGTKVCLGLAGQRVLGRFFELPPMPSKKVQEAIRFEVQHQLPIPLDELCWSHEILDEAPAKEADNRPRRILVQAARQAHVSERLALCKAAGIAADLVQSDCVALHNALVYELFAETAGSAPHCVAAIDAGTEATNVVISSPRYVWFRTFTQGGNSFTRELVRQLKLTHEQAELLKRDPAKAPGFSQLAAAFQPLLVQFGDEVQRSLATFSRLRADIPVQRVYGLGGGFQTHGLLRYLRSGK